MKINTVIVDNSWMSRPGRHAIDVGWGSGYAILPKGHPCWGMDHYEIHEKYDVNVHGGLTYSGNPKNLREGGEQYVSCWAIGFDTVHFRDTLVDWPKERVQAEADRLHSECWKYGYRKRD